MRTCWSCVVAAGMLAMLVGCAETSTVESYTDVKDVKKDTGGDSGVIIGPEDVTPDDALPDGTDAGGDATVEDLDLGLDFAFPPEVGDQEDGLDLIEPPDEIEPEDIPPEIAPDIQPDIPECEPKCGTKECGSDGCDGVCGYCAYGYLCSPEGKCVTDICPKQCMTEVDGEEVPKECGSDGCGGYCGYCLEEDEICKPDGFCYPGQCTPDCGGKVCGADGCGSVCGFCQKGEMCNEDGACVPHPCGTVTYKGTCQDKYVLVECIDLELKTTQCKSQPGKMCGWDENVGKYNCVEETACEPQCLFEDGNPKECGPDGCWGECGICPQGWGCGGGLCKPSEGGECAWIDSAVGACDGTIKWFCSAGKLYGYDCMGKEEKTCGWNPKFNFGLGGYDCI
jgi:hypothetical protein